MTFPLVFISSSLEIVSGKKKTFTANFAKSAENNADPVFIKSGIYTLALSAVWLAVAKYSNWARGVNPLCSVFFFYFIIFYSCKFLKIVP